MNFFPLGVLLQVNLINNGNITKETIMKYITFALALSLTALSVFAGDSAEDLAKKADRASKIVLSLSNELEIPSRMLKEADCVAAITIVKGGIAGFGAKSGQGVATCRTDNGWSNPSILNVNGGSFGPQIGVGKVSMLMIYKGDSAVRQLKNKSFTGDMQISAVAGPIGREAGMGIDVKLENGIYAYSKAKGFYFGATLGAAMISVDKSSNTALYNGIEDDISTILETPASDKLPMEFQEFIAVIDSVK